MAPMPETAPFDNIFIVQCEGTSDLFPTAVFEPSPVGSVPGEGGTAPLDGSGVVRGVPVVFSFIIYLVSRLVSRGQHVVWTNCFAYFWSRFGLLFAFPFLLYRIQRVVAVVIFSGVTFFP